MTDSERLESITLSGTWEFRDSDADSWQMCQSDKPGWVPGRQYRYREKSEQPSAVACPTCGEPGRLICSDTYTHDGCTTWRQDKRKPCRICADSGKDLWTNRTLRRHRELWRARALAAEADRDAWHKLVEDNELKDAQGQCSKCTEGERLLRIAHEQLAALQTHHADVGLDLETLMHDLVIADCSDFAERVHELVCRLKNRSQ